MNGTSRVAAAAAVVVMLPSAAGCSSAEPTAKAPDPVTSAAAPTGSPAGSPTGSAPEGPPVLSFDFDDLGALRSAGAGTGDLRVLNAGSERVTVRVSAAGGGRLRSIPDRDGGFAVRFPAYARGSGERVVVTATSDSVTDPLSPGSDDFTFGADFALDQITEGTGLDNGNNLVQRGLSGDLGQYKIQIDGGRASCLVKGDAGAVLVKTEQRIRPNTWYSVSCTRTGDEITLDLGVHDVAPERAVESGPTGAVYLPVATPLVLGGKATSEGEAVVGDSDQFNGTMDNLFLTIDQGS